MKNKLSLLINLSLLVLLGASSGLAQTTENIIGIYRDPSGLPDTNFASVVLGELFTAYLVVTNPTNDNFNGSTETSRPINWVSGFSCRITMPPRTSFILVGEEFASPNGFDCDDCRPDYSLTFDEAVPVVDGAAVLVTWNMVILGMGEYDLFLGPTEQSPPSNDIYIVDAEDPQAGRSEVSTADDNSVPAFIINENIGLAAESNTWGSLKSLFR